MNPPVLTRWYQCNWRILFWFKCTESVENTM